MKNIDVEIYFSQLHSFFEKNPNDLISLIGKSDRDIFYENGDEIQLTNQQLIGVVLEVLDINKDQPVDKTFFETKLGKICMN